MTRRTIDYERLGVEACEAYTEGPETFADFVGTILSVAARCMYFKPQSAPCQRNHSMRSRRCPRRDTDLAHELAAYVKLQLNDQERQAVGRALAKRKARLIEMAGDTGKLSTRVGRGSLSWRSSARSRGSCFHAHSADEPATLSSKLTRGTGVEVVLNQNPGRFT
jgi:hypothetical protein